ncbi:GTP cyclohydrolase FolE2 [Planctobacterium marinum]|uniref:GTP cyclohydrolase FolE2 n=1 Tax=Planctobacterium marinum TaxID=1631968 RepID=UPI001E42BE4C|nr:GTP cyclohydrolase FolE2 [Planctobacterium marinum]MCC2607866.1 GTP cyclohydrolase FolE2 [Planctobacterium marinum]
MHKDSNPLPDITNQAPQNAQTNSPLQWVGMEKIGLPIQLQLSDETLVSVNASADLFVSLDTASKGIHMSRLYLKLQEILANAAVTLESLNTLLDAMLQSHIGISQSAKVRLVFEIPLRKKALLSENYGYQLYPIEITQQINASVSETELNITVPYSSTCPCSASLANQLNSEAFARQFGDEMLSRNEAVNWIASAGATMATPHNQRSYAYLKLQLAPGHWLKLDEFIQSVEQAIGTPVQTAVKREDEQEFARLNGANLMFCEDAGRRMKRFLEAQENLADYWFKVEHQESLHAHNAVVIHQKA